MDTPGWGRVLAVQPDALRRRRAAAQLLDGTARREPAAVVGHLLAVQAQDLRSARLALRARSAGLRPEDVDRALTEERSLVVTWLGRGTLHLVRREDFPWLWGLTASTALAASRRRLGRLGVSPSDAERAVGVVTDALAREGPMPRDALVPQVAAAGISTEGQAGVHLLRLAALRGAVVLGPVRDGRQAYVLTEDWLGEPPQEQDVGAREAALAELARRYLRGHGPATAADLAGWSGLGLRDARAGLRGSGAVPVRPEVGGLVDVDEAADARPAAEPVTPRLLPAFDPYVLGWRDRTFAVPFEHLGTVHPGGGTFRAVATVDGRAVGTWSSRRPRPGALRMVDVALFPGEDPGALEALRPEADDVVRFTHLR
ncbi:MAG: winged helix DNA-binding domain-containing protein [Actinomycetes bacterium]